ncbi:odorant receptor 85b-like [Halyomorpha halys]|uniref:odorant receptor 85b-like n=1 Tax=Halyomorpha halys TaxID=286706 RepID=UPI0034D15776|nr:Odorant receptor 50 [Halyomorpha halys]
MGDKAAITDSDVIDGINIKYLKFFGLWGVINDYRTTEKKNSVLKFQVIITLLLMVPSIICQYVGFFVIEVDLQKASILNFHSLPSLQVCCKHLVFWFHLDRICRLNNLMTKNFLKESIPEFQSEKVISIYRKIIKQTNIFCLVALVVVFTGLSLIVLNPDVPVDYILYHTGNMFDITTGRFKISTGWYPLPMDKSPWYEIVLVYEGTLVVWGSLFVLAFICFYYQILMCLYAHFVVLGSHISDLNIDSDYQKNSIEYKKFNLQRYRELYRILQDHQKLLSYTAELKSVYNPLVTMILGVGISVLVLAVFHFMFGQTGDLVFIIRSFCYVLYQSIEVTMFCYGSSFIQTASSDLQFAIYSSDWYKADVKFRKAAQMMMIRAKKGETLTAIRMYPVNAETIMAILQFTYSVATLMSRFIE